MLKSLNRDLQNPNWIYAKGVGFLLIIIMCFVAIIFEEVRWRRAAFGVCLIWSSARFYYFLFYVIEKYVDPSFRFVGIGSVIRYWISKIRK